MSDESNLIQKQFVKMIEQFKYSKSEIIESAGSLEKPEIIKLNIGGTIFSTLKSTLTKQIRDKDSHSYPPNIFECILEGYSKPILDENEAIFIDRSPKYFDHILDYLRNVDLNNNYTLTEDVDLDELNQEAKYYNLKGLEELTSKVKNETISEITDKETLKIDSVILNEQQIKDLYKLCEFPNDAKFELLYRTSRDGFSTNNFHENCDNIPFTLTIIKTITGDILGGFTEEEWTSHPCSKTGPNAFIFSLKNDENKQLKMKIRKEFAGYSIFCASGHGPTFGFVHDIYICDYSNAKNESYHQFGNCYKNLDENGKHFKPEKVMFQTSEIEVFQKL